MRIAFILSRFGDEVVGGAETLARRLAVEAVRQGWQVEVWTTCATNYTTWNNELPPGRDEVEGVPVIRFPVDSWDPASFHALSKKLQLHFALAVDEQYDWLASGPHSTPLYRHVAAHGAEWDVVIVLPYLNSITYHAAWLAGNRVVMLPCLHNEVFAYMEPFRVLLESVWGVVFISPEEASLAIVELKMRIRRNAVLGSGVTLSDLPSGTIDQVSPYLLYVGRLGEGKNVPLLYDYVARYVDEGGDLRLVVAGDGSRKPPDHPAFDFRGFVSEEEKARLYTSALALCQPSYNESFSLVLMESWLAERPVLVWSACEVTRGHVGRSKGGLWFASYAEFKGAVEWLQHNPSAAEQMGQNGRNYVKQNYRWDHIFLRFAGKLTDWQREAI